MNILSIFSVLVFCYILAFQVAFVEGTLGMYLLASGYWNQNNTRSPSNAPRVRRANIQRRIETASPANQNLPFQAAPPSYNDIFPGTEREESGHTCLANVTALNQELPPPPYEAPPPSYQESLNFPARNSSPMPLNQSNQSEISSTQRPNDPIQVINRQSELLVERV